VSDGIARLGLPEAAGKPLADRRRVTMARR
jgi:hypothetical protein